MSSLRILEFIVARELVRGLIYANPVDEPEPSDFALHRVAHPDHERIVGQVEIDHDARAFEPRPVCAVYGPAAMDDVVLGLRARERTVERGFAASDIETYAVGQHDAARIGRRLGRVLTHAAAGDDTVEPFVCRTQRHDRAE